MGAETSACTSLGAHTSAHARLGAQMSAHTNLGENTSTHTSACMCAFFPPPEYYKNLLITRLSPI